MKRPSEFVELFEQSVGFFDSQIGRNRVRVALVNGFLAEQVPSSKKFSIVFG